MDIVGKIIVALPEVTGVAKATGRSWKKREYVLETTNDAFPRKVHFDFFGDRADQFPLEVGQVVRLFFDIESREYQGRWYTGIRGIRVEDATAMAPQQPYAAPAQASPYGAPQQANPYPPAPPVVDPNLAQATPTDDLPF